MTHPEKQRQFYVFSGSYSGSDREGIVAFGFDAKKGGFTRLHGVPGVENPSFLAFDAQRNRLFAVSETRDGAVVSFGFNPEDGTLTEINRRSTKGDFPCHLNIDASGSWLVAVNYLSGSVALFPVQDGGAIGEMADFVQHRGRSIRSDRQASPHPHSIVNIPQTDFWLVPDLGTDHIYVYRLDHNRGKLEPHADVPTAAGAGPRHIAFHPHKPVAYAIEELGSAISAYRYDRAEGTLEFIQTIGTLPAGFAGENLCADIHVSASGHFLYGSNRGHDSIAAFRILADGRLEPLGHVSTMGRTPRNFALVGNEPVMLVANQDSNTVVPFRISEVGLPVPGGDRLETPKPVCLRAVPCEDGLASIPFSESRGR